MASKPSKTKASQQNTKRPRELDSDDSDDTSESDHTTQPTTSASTPRWGCPGGAMVLGNLPVPGRPTIWITVVLGPTALAVGAGGGCLDIFILIYLFSPLSPSLWETARYRLKYCLKGPLNPKQPTNQSTPRFLVIASRQERQVASLSPFIIEKVLHGIAGVPQSIKKTPLG